MNNKLLVIDDDHAVRKSFSLTFENSHYKVETAGSGQEGINLLKKNTYDLVFIDLKMPEMDGIETMRAIREVNREVILYIFTAFHKEYFRKLEEAAREGFDFEIVQKPLDRHQLLELVENTLLKKE